MFGLKLLKASCFIFKHMSKLCFVVVCFFFCELILKHLHHVRCTVCNCQSNVFVYLKWPPKACNNNGVLMQTYNKKMCGI